MGGNVHLRRYPEYTVLRIPDGQKQDRALFQGGEIADKCILADYNVGDVDRKFHPLWCGRDHDGKLGNRYRLVVIHGIIDRSRQYMGDTPGRMERRITHHKDAHGACTGNNFCCNFNFCIQRDRVKNLLRRLNRGNPMTKVNTYLFIPCLLVLFACAAKPHLGIDRQNQTTQKIEDTRHDTITFYNWRFMFELPSDKWELHISRTYRKPNLRDTYMFKREGIPNSENILVEPVIGFIFEHVPRGQDVYEYHIAGNLPGIKEISIFTHEDGLIVLQNAIGTVRTYVREGVEHTVKQVDAVDGEIGTRVIMDVTSDLFKVVEPEFDRTLRSMQFLQ